MKEATQIQNENTFVLLAQNTMANDKANNTLTLSEEDIKQGEQKTLSESFRAESKVSTEFVSPLTYDYLTGIGVLLFMLFMLYFILWGLKKYGKGKFIPFASSINREDLKVEARVPLDAKKTLYVIKYLNKRLLIGGTDSSLSLLSEDYIFENDAQSESEEEKLGARQDFKETVQQFNTK